MARVGAHALVGRLAQLLLGIVELALQQRNLPRERLVGGPVALDVLVRALGLGQLLLGLVEVGLEVGDLVLQRNNLLVLLHQLEFELLVLGLGTVDDASGLTVALQVASWPSVKD